MYRKLREVPPADVVLAHEMPDGARTFCPMSLQQVAELRPGTHYYSEVIQYPAKLFMDLNQIDPKDIQRILIDLAADFQDILVFTKASQASWDGARPCIPLEVCGDVADQGSRGWVGGTAWASAVGEAGPTGEVSVTEPTPDRESVADVHIIAPRAIFNTPRQMKDWVRDRFGHVKGLDLKAYRANSILRIPGALKRTSLGFYSGQLQLISSSSWKGYISRPSDQGPSSTERAVEKLLPWFTSTHKTANQYFLTRRAPTHCTVCNRTHNTAAALATVSSLGEVYLRCSESKNKGGKYIGTLS
jgi:hypothetical protein